MIIGQSLMELLMPCYNTLSGMLKKKDTLSQKHKDPILIANFVDTNVKTNNKSSNFLISYFYP